MSLLGFLLLLLIAAIAGAVGQSLSGYSRGGCLVSIVIGFLGAYLGVWLASELRLPEVLMVDIEGQQFPLLWSIVGSALLSLGLGVLARQRRLA